MPALACLLCLSSCSLFASPPLIAPLTQCCSFLLPPSPSPRAPPQSPSPTRAFMIPVPLLLHSEEKIQPSFLVGMVGVEPEDAAAVHSKIMETLEGLAENGFEEADIQASLNRIEMKLRLKKPEDHKFGVTLLEVLAGKWVWERDILEAMDWEARAKELERKVELLREEVRDLPALVVYSLTGFAGIQGPGARDGRCPDDSRGGQIFSQHTPAMPPSAPHCLPPMFCRGQETCLQT